MKKIFLLLPLLLAVISVSLSFPNIIRSDCQPVMGIGCGVYDDDRNYYCSNPDLNENDFCCIDPQDCYDFFNSNDPVVGCADDGVCLAEDQNCCPWASKVNSTGCSTGIKCVVDNSETNLVGNGVCLEEGQKCLYGLIESADSSCTNTGIKCIGQGGNVACNNSPLFGNCLPNCNPYTYEEDKGINGCPSGTTCCVVTPNPPVITDCNNVSDPEFHSLRPYSGRECVSSTKALFCSNDLIFTEIFDISKFPSCISQAPDKDGAFTCTPSKNDGKVYAHNLIADLYNSEFPILGNTEDVINSISNLDTFDDATKVNEYVSWYLNGVTGKAEYGNTKNTNEAITNYSGPLKKLLPQVIQEAQRISIVESGIMAKDNNNQIVVCAQEEKFGVLGRSIPVECYDGNGNKANAEVYRLASQGGEEGWNGNLSLFNTLWNANPFNNWVRNSDAWNKRIPPLPWDDGNGKSFESDVLYKKAYNEWRGKACVILPIIGLTCIDNPLVANKWAELFSYIPLSKTPDKLGEEFATGIEYVATSGTIDIDSQSPKETTNIKPASLFFAHTQESKDLIGLLNKVFTPMNCANTNGDLSCSPLTNAPEPGSTEQIECSTVNVRTNPGDQLFPNGPNQFKIPNVTYQITSVPCKVTNKIISYGGCNYWEDPNICSGQPLNTCCDPVIEKIVTCNAEIAITVKTDSTTPYANEIFQDAVSGTGSTFRKMFPKVEPGAPVECIADIPSVSSVTYDAANSQKPAGGTLNFDVKNPTTGSIGSAQLTFPHIGSIYEYFLKGIQTALRPKGYGESLVSGLNCVSNTNPKFGDICAVADKYSIPCCQLQGIEQVETGGGVFVRKETCNTKNGTFSCCNGNVCGPAQINCSQYNGFTGNDNIDVCDIVGAAELAARAMLLKLCQADFMSGRNPDACSSYDWAIWGDYASLNYAIQDGDYTATGYFYGVNSCAPTGCSQLRWGTGNSYCDGVKSYCETGNILPEVNDQSYCPLCRDEMVASGMPTFKCPGE